MSEITHLKAENAKLQDENARLRSCLSDDAENARMIMAENAKLRNEVDNLLDFEHLTSVAVAYAGCDECGEYKQTMLCLFAENAKLRELVQDIYGVMWACAEQRCTHRHDGCFRVHGNHGDICVSERCWYEDRMRELGIEVDA